MTFRSLLPPNPTQGELAQEQVHSHVGNMPIDIRTVKNADLCPVELLPHLAWEYGVTFWEDMWSEAQKRDVIKSAPRVNKARGTIGAVKEAISATGYSVDIVEWFNDTPQAAPYTFKLIVNNIVSDAAMEDIALQVKDAKNARSGLSSVTIKPAEVQGEFYMGGAIHGRITASIGIM